MLFCIVFITYYILVHYIAFHYFTLCYVLLCYSNSILCNTIFFYVVIICNNIMIMMMFIICYERFAVSVIGWKPWPFLGNRKNVEFAIALFLGRGTERVVNNMIRWCVQDKRSFRLAKLPRAALVSPFHPALQDMFLQCEGFESLPLPPAIRTVAVDAAWPNAHSFWVGGVSFNGLKSQVFRCIFMVVRAVLGRVFMCLYIGLNVEAF